MECNLLVGGQAGQGLASIENQLTDLLSRLGYSFCATRFYRSRIRGAQRSAVFQGAEKLANAVCFRPSGFPWPTERNLSIGEQKQNP